MSITHGMNPEEVDHLGQFLKGKASELQDLASRVDSAIGRTGWAGPDARRFQDEWWPKHKTRIIAAAESVDGLGQSALNNASEQRRASSASFRSNHATAMETVTGTGTGTSHGVTATPVTGGAGEVGGFTGKLPSADRSWQEVNQSYMNASGLGVHTYGGDPGYTYQCTAWAKLRWQELGYSGDLSGALGHGGAMAGNLGGTTSTPVTLGAMVSYGAGTDGDPGHVMIVEEISADGTRARVSEWNNGDQNWYVGTADEYRSNRWVSRGADGLWRSNGNLLTIASLP